MTLIRLSVPGKILQDANTVESYGIEEKGFIVCMTQKVRFIKHQLYDQYADSFQAKPAPAAAQSSTAAPSTPAPATSQTPAAPAAPGPATSSTQNAPATPSPAPATAAESSRSLTDTNAMALGQERAAAIADMESMGFARSDIDRAMRAAYFNPDRAVEYLLNVSNRLFQIAWLLTTEGRETNSPRQQGIPEHLLREDRPAQSPSQPAAGAPPAQQPAQTTQQTTEAAVDAPINLFEAAAQAAQGGTGGRGAGGRGATLPGAEGRQQPTNLDFLRNNPQFQQLRQLVHQQPQMLEPILQQVGAGNPQLAQMITSNPEQFLQLLAEDDEGDAALPPGAQTISVTEEEREAIERVSQTPHERFLNEF